MHHHPLSGHLGHHNHQLGFLDWLKDAGQNVIDNLTQPVKDQLDSLIGEENRLEIDRLISAGLHQEAEKLKKKAMEEAYYAIHGRPKTGITGTLNDIWAGVQLNPVVASIPGGIFTILGIAGVGAYLIFRK